jgi:hypothetical protein
MFLPFFYVYGLLVSLASIYVGTNDDKKNRKKKLILKTIEKYKIAALPLVPPLAVF